METFLGKSQLYDMTEFSGAEDKEVFDGNTFLLKISEENNKHRYILDFWAEWLVSLRHLSLKATNFSKPNIISDRKLNSKKIGCLDFVSVQPLSRNLIGCQLKACRFTTAFINHMPFE